MLDYSKQKKSYLNVKMADGTLLLIGTPKKALFTRLSVVEETLKDTDEVGDVYDEILALCAEILSNNKDKKTFTADDVDNLMDIEDMALLIREYSTFAGGIIKNPN